MAEVELEFRGAFTVGAGATQDGTVVVDPDHLDPEVVAELIEQAAPGISLCHDCATELHDPELKELTAFEIAGRRFSLTAGRWVEET